MDLKSVIYNLGADAHVQRNQPLGAGFDAPAELFAQAPNYSGASAQSSGVDFDVCGDYFLRLTSLCWFFLFYFRWGLISRSL
jgi:hypothetical protein